jgi:Na+-transporting NADH:ubiquinone oxidoreductase subunit E
MGLPELDLSYLALIAFIGVIAATVQFLEMLLDRFFPAIHAAFGVFLPLLTVQCAILAGSLFMVERNYSVAESAIFGLGSGTGFAAAVIMLSAIRKRLAYADLPAGLRGLGIAFVLTGLMSLGFATFSQMAAAQ